MTYYAMNYAAQGAPHKLRTADPQQCTLGQIYISAVLGSHLTGS